MLTNGAGAVQPTRRRPLARELSSGFRLIVAAATVMVVAVLGMLAFTVFVSNPDRSAAEQALAQTLRVNEDFFNLRTDVRVFLATGDPSYQSRYAGDRTRLRAAVGRLHQIEPATLHDTTASVSGAADNWITGYGDRFISTAGRARLLEPDGGFDDRRFGRATVLGVRLSSTLQSVITSRITALDAMAQSADSREELALLAGSGFLVLVAVASAVLAVTRSRRLVGSYAQPIAILLTNVQAVGRGEFRVDAPSSSVSEIAALSDGIADMATSLRLQQKALSSRAEQSQRLAERLRRVLGFAREISSGLTVPTVLTTISKSAGQLAGTSQVRIWLLDDSGQLRVAHGSGAGPADPRLPREGPSVPRAVESAAATGAAVRGEDGADKGRYSLPLISNGRTIGVLEICLPDHRPSPSEEALEVLEVVANQGATAIEAARLYQHTERLSLSDPLTGLGNRRRLDNDLALEVERAVRYERPMALLMIDVDHFKTINDTHGHAHGDSVLQALAAALSDHMRSVDTGYRYGGEELAILARETDLAGAALLGERLRVAIESAFAASQSPATVSIGIATAPGQGRSADELSRAADRALYAAKRAGRNRVVVADGAAAAESTPSWAGQPGAPGA